jgi:plastocyanin
MSMKKRNLITVSLLLLLSSFLFIACSKDSDDAGTSGNNSNKIYMKNSVFNSANLIITQGTTVTWVNDDNMLHTVTADDGSFHSGDIQVNGTYTRTFTATGVYFYHCIYHMNMTGKVTVLTK